jgi:hypothetical protein
VTGSENLIDIGLESTGGTLSGTVEGTSRVNENPTMYRGYELEQKSLLVGWQVMILKENMFVRNSSICNKLSIALDEAHDIVDNHIAADTSGPPPVSSR